MAQYTDDFSTDPASRWTAEAGTTFAHDAANAEMDINVNNGVAVRYSANNPGSIEHEAQVTAVVNAANDRLVGAGVRHESGGADDWYGVYYGGSNTWILGRWNAGSRTSLTSWVLTTGANEFWTVRLAAEGVAGANVVLSVWLVNHGTSKPSDPGWIGSVGVDEAATFTDSNASRLDDATHIQGGIGSRNLASDFDTRHCYWKVRAISDRSGGGSFQPAWARRSNYLIGVGA